MRAYVLEQGRGDHLRIRCQSGANTGLNDERDIGEVVAARSMSGTLSMPAVFQVSDRI